MDEEIQKQLGELARRIIALESSPFVRHQHNGFDSVNVEYDDIAHKKLYVDWTLPGTSAATATNYGVFYILPTNAVFVAFQEVHQTAGSNGSPVTLTLEKLTGTTAPDAGVEMLTTALSLKATANTVQTGVPTLTLGNRTLKMGDRLCLKDAGTLTAVANVTIRVELIVL